MIKIFKILFLSLIILFSISNSFSSLEVFTAYDTKITINNNETIDVQKIILLRNINDVGIVPGQIEFKINTGSDIEILEYEVLNKNLKPIKNTLSKTKNSAIIKLDIFTPVLPGFEYKINLKYKLKYNSNGFLFKKLELPLYEKTRIPIKKGSVEISFPDKYYLTYLSYEDNKTEISENTIYWELNEKVPETISFEYSRIPIKIGKVAGSIVFWLIINLILITILIREVRKELKKLKGKEKIKHKKIK